MAKKFTEEDEALLAELGVEVKATKTAKYTPREERIIAGFEEIQRFVEEQGRLPEHGENRDIFERLYAVRLDRLRASEECVALLSDLDTGGLLTRADQEAPETTTDEELLAALGVEPDKEAGVTELKHVRSREEKKVAEEIAKRTPCEDFAQFKPFFAQVQSDLKSGKRKTVKYKDYSDFKKGDLFILDGQKVIVADVGEEFVADYGRPDRRLRAVYDNGTESDLLLRSLQRALYRDDTSRRITELDDHPLFADEMEDADSESGHIYILRSRSDHPFIAENRDLLHKIGVTGQNVNHRISNAKKDPTFLLADVELVETYKLANINRNKLEKVLHQFFNAARMDLELRDRFDESVQPKEWFLVPLPAIRKAIELLISGEIENFHYDLKKAEIIPGRREDLDQEREVDLPDRQTASHLP